MKEQTEEEAGVIGVKEKICTFLNELDVNNKRIFWHLRWHRHAKLSELTKLFQDSNDMEILCRLRDVINPAAERSFGIPIIEFNKSKIDNVTGEKILFNWWLSDYLEYFSTINVETSKPLIDIYDDKDKIIIISDIVPSIKVSDTASVEQRNGMIIVSLKKI